MTVIAFSWTKQVFPWQLGARRGVLCDTSWWVNMPWKKTYAGWWLNHPSEKYLSKWESSPNRGENNKYLSCYHLVCHVRGSPKTPMTSIFEGQPPRNKTCSSQNNRHLGSRYIYIYLYIYIYIPCRWVNTWDVNIPCRHTVNRFFKKVG